MFLIPLGHDRAIRRIPWVTIAIMAICVLVQLHRTFFAPFPHEFERAATDLATADQRLVMRFTGQGMPKPPQPSVDPEHGFDDASVAPAPGEEPPPPPVDPVADAYAAGVPTDTILARVHQHQLGNDADPAVADVHAAQSNLERLKGRDLAYSMGYFPHAHPISAQLVLSAFAHGGWLHLLGNLVFLWICGCNLEDRWGRVIFSAFYLASAIASSFAFLAVHHADDTFLIGASGAIAGAMGAFVVCFASAQIKWLIVWFFTFRLKWRTFYSPAYVALPLWFLAQVLQLVLEISGAPGIAFSGHVGGFGFGLVFAFGFKLTGVDAKLVKAGDDEAGPEWEEHPEFLRAVDLVDREPAEAQEILRKVLVERPTHAEATVLLARAAAHTGDVAALGASVSRAVSKLVAEERTSELATLVTGLEKHLAPTGPFAVDERTSAQLVHGSLESGDPKLLLRLARAHQLRFPSGSTMPRVLWDVASAQKRAGAEPQARATLARLVQEYPTHALAEKARNELAGVGVTAGTAHH